MIPNTVIGRVTGTGAALNVVLGFKPDYVELVNSATGATLKRFRGSTGMSIAASGAITVAAGLTDFTGPDGEGFTIPAGASANGVPLNYLAVRSAPGAS